MTSNERHQAEAESDLRDPGGAPEASESNTERAQQQAAEPRSETNDNTSEQQVSQQVSSAPPPRRPRPASRRHVVIGVGPAPVRPQPADPEQAAAAAAAAAAAVHAMELASLVPLGPSARASIVPPRRPMRPTLEHGQPQPHHGLHHHHHHHQHHQRLPSSLGPQTSLGATAVSSSVKPNRYAWAQMQQWQAAAAAAAAAAQQQQQSAGQQAQVSSNDQATGSNYHHQHHRHHQPTTSGFNYHGFASPFASAASRVLVVGNPIVNLSEHTKSRLIKLIEALKRFSEKWFSHVLLLLFLAVYACFGAYVFISFEAPTEQWEKQQIIDTRLRIVNESFDGAHSHNREEYVDLFRGQFEEYERLLNRVCASGMTSSSLENQWTFWGALFYSMTVFTTIGYGHLTPVTFAGRVATMVYAIFGIPILLMVLADLGKLLTRIIKYAFKKFRYLYNKLLGRKASVRTRKLISDNTNQYIGVARDAFERGFAHYLQSYQQRIPSAFRMHHSATPAEAATASVDDAPATINSENINANHNNNNNNNNNHHHHHHHGARLESTGVIVTPVKQTKPVSPPIGALQGFRKSPPSGEPTINHTNQHHHSAPSKRSQSPAASSSGRRKISSGKNHCDSKTRSNSSTNQASSAYAAAGTSAAGGGKNSVSRSSSSSNVVCGSSSSVSNALVGQQKSNKVINCTDGTNNTQATDGSHQTNASGDQQKMAANMAGEQEQQQPHQEINIDGQQSDETHQATEQEDKQQQQPQTVDGQQYEDEEDFDIPVSFALFLLITYMMFGAVVFSIWEGWNFFDALYFVFISMSTIGFGDLVPQHPKRMIGTFAYLLFGLALTSMCINVVQEKIHATFLRAKMQIGEKMGFDLDQIMADDYYDSGSAFGDADYVSGEHDDEDTNSVAVSQTNSASFAGGAGPIEASSAGAGGSQKNLKTQSTVELSAPGAQDSNVSQPNLDSNQLITTQTASGKQSARPKETVSSKTDKWKKRTSDGNSGWSLRRKSSSSKKSASTTAGASNARQASAMGIHSATTPTSPVSLGPEGGQRATLSLDSSDTSGPNKPIPIESKLERLSNHDFSTASVATNGSGQPVVGINQPVQQVGIKAFCEPLRQASSDSNNYFQKILSHAQKPHSNTNMINLANLTPRPKLTATLSQPDSFGSQANSIDLGGSTSPTWNQSRQSLKHSAKITASNNYNHQQMLQPNKHLTPTSSSRAEILRGRSLGSSPRRASVSHELSQLDDLIVALSRTPSERFGPLLGIPSTTSGHSSRSNSPTTSNNSTLRSITGIGGGNLSPRRGTSMTSRPMSTTPRPPIEKKRSLASQMPTSMSAQRLTSLVTKTSNSTGPTSSAREPLNLSESQAALDELEALKYSII